VPLQLETVQQALAERYDIDTLLSKGGMSYVFSGHRRRDGRTIAVKVFRPEFAVTILRDRFHQEIEFLAALDHPNILPLLESGESGLLIYYVCPYARGGSLAERLCREHRLPLEDAVRITRDLAAALDYAHSQNVLHRDIKPQNVIFDEERVLLCDFGVARALVRAAGDRISSSGLVVGTPTYMSPEQASGQGQLDRRSDIYALACLVYEMLAGEPPFTGATPQAVFARQIAERPPSLRVVRPDLPQHVEDAVNRALAKSPRRRPGTGAAFVRLLQLPAPADS
jgi:serine/threonine-protein kinase